MKMVKSLLLGTAAGLVAIAGAQAADLPVKAKPVDYVRICSAYGAGFYYIPGTDICLRVGGYVFIESGWNARAGTAYIYNYNIGGNSILNRDDNRINWRTRGDLILDARSQTAIGTVRTYISIGADYNNFSNGNAPGLVATTSGIGASSLIAAGNITPYLERAFIQFAGFTAGQAASFFDFGAFYSIYGLSSIAWNWLPLFAYTAQFGNGVSATISLEDGQAHRSLIPTAATPVPWTGTVANISTGYGGQVSPDIVANVRVDQAWGSAQVSGALHQLRLNEVFSTAAGGISDGWGWAVLGGIEIKTPMIAPGDSIMLQGVWSRGAVEYTGISASPLASIASVGLRSSGLAFGGPAFMVFDAFAFAGGSLELTTAWSANLMFRHFWQPNLRSAFWVGHNKVETPANSQGVAAGFPTDLTIWQVGGNIIWSPAPTLDLSLDALWTRVAVGACPGNAAPTTSGCDQSADIWSFWTRWRRNF